MLVSQILANIFRNPAVHQAENATAAYNYKLLEKNRIFVSNTRIKHYQQLIETIFEQLSTADYWKITPSFIEDLGSAYISMLGRWHAEALGV